MPRGDGPFRVLEKINDNAYKLELPGELCISSTFNVTDLAPFDAGEPILRSESFQEGGDNEAIQPEIDQPGAELPGLTQPENPRLVEEPISLPTMRQPPRTRSGIKNLREEFNTSIEALIIYMEHNTTNPRLVSREAPVRARSNSTSQLAGEEAHSPHEQTPKAQDQEGKNGSGARHFYLGPSSKSQWITMLPVLEGIRDCQVLSISRSIQDGEEMLRIN